MGGRGEGQRGIYVIAIWRSLEPMHVMIWYLGHTTGETGAHGPIAFCTNLLRTKNIETVSCLLFKVVFCRIPLLYGSVPCRRMQDFRNSC